MLQEHRALVSADERNRPRSAAEWFVQLSGRCAFGDVSPFTVLDAYRIAGALTQPRATGFGGRLVNCLDEVDEALGGWSDGPEDSLLNVFTSVPPAVVLGATEPDVHFHLVCVTAACSALDGIDTPYLAARAWANMRVLRPAEDLGVTAIGERLAIRYEDEPTARDEVDAEIRVELARYLAAVPFDV